MNKGIVLEIQKKNVLLLTRDGKFVKCIKKQGNYAIGQEIVFTEEELLPNRKYLFAFPFLKPILMISCCFLVAFLFFYNGRQEKVMAYVSIDINPSIEASVDSNFRVLRLEAYNAEGEQIIKKLKNWEKQPLSDVIGQVINRCRLDGYLTKETPVALTSVVVDNNKMFQQKLEPILQTIRTKYAKESVSIVYQEGTVQMRENARGSRMSTGAYMEKEKAKQSPLVVPKSPSPVPEHPPASNQIEQAPHPSSEEQHNTGSQEETVKEKEKSNTPQNNKPEEKVKKEKESPYQSGKQEEKAKQKNESLDQNDKREEKAEQKNERLNQNDKREEKVEQKNERLNQNDKREEKIEQKNERLNQNGKREEKIQKKKQSLHILPNKERKKRIIII